MKISRLKIRNFRGIKSADLLFPDHVVFIGDNKNGKSTIIEAIDLVLGPDRLSRRPPIDEHDFYIGKYLPGDASNESVEEPAELAEAGDSEAAADEVEVTAVEAVEPEGEPDADEQAIAESEIVQIRIEARMVQIFERAV